MNKAQNRPTLHKVLSMILALVMVLSLLPLSGFTASDNDAVEGYDYNIMFLDCGRKYFSVSSIKSFIDEASAAGFNYIQLAVGNDGMRFLLDDMSLTVNGTTYSSEQVSAAIHSGNEAYYNFDTDELTQSEMDTIIAYANEKGMGVIPCINTPGHMDAILDAAEELTNKTCSYNGSTRTIDVTNSTAVSFTKAFLQKYINYFASKGCTLFNMGADEYANDKYTSGSMGFGNLQSEGKYSCYVTYVNEVAEMIKDAGMKPMAFNDGIYFNSNTSSGTFDTDILICYWSRGWGSYNPMPATTLASKGFKLINTHGDYYYVLGGTAQCSADKAKEFDYKTFQGSTVENPAGSMFCIWCDDPGAGAEASVISSTSATIAAFGGTLPAVEEFNAVPSSTVYNSSGSTTSSESDVLSVTASGLTSLTCTQTTAPAINDAEADKIQAYDVTPKTADGNYTGSASVSIKIPSGWDNSKVRGFVVNSDNTVTSYTGTVSNDFYTFTASHFSVMGLYQLAAASDTETEEIKITVGGTATVTQSNVDSSGSITGGDSSIATASAEYKNIESSTTKTLGSQITSFSKNGTTGVISDGVGNYLVIDSNGNISNTNDINAATEFTVTSTTKNNKTNYTIEGSNDYVLSVSDSSGRLLYASKESSTTWKYDGDKGFYFQKQGGNSYYLTPSWSISKNSVSSYGNLYSVSTKTGETVQVTEITFTGVAVGTTEIQVGNVLYTITVKAEDVSKVDPIKLEYWLTNTSISTVTGAESEPRTNIKSETYYAYYTPVKADSDGVATENGIDVTTIAPATTRSNEDNRDLYYWRCRLLDKNVTNSYGSLTEWQTNDGGDDDTWSGVGFTKIRYYGSQWQVFTENNQWVNVESKHQLVAYYLEYIKVSDEVESFAADWGGRGTGDYGPWMDTSSYCTLSMQVVYEDGTTNPRGTDATSLAAKTMVYGYWTDGRGIGTVMLNGSEFEIYKVTAETGYASVSFSGNYHAKANSFTWDGNEQTVWVGQSSNVEISNDSHNPSKDGANANLVWDENQEAILLRVYVRAKVTEDSLTVHYMDKTNNNEEFYSYNIAVKEGTYFKDDIGLPDTDGGDLKNSEVTNIRNVEQKITTDLSKMPEINAKYRYQIYKCVEVEQSPETKSKNVYLYYTFSNQTSFVIDFGLPVKIPFSSLGDLAKAQNITKVEVSGCDFGTTCCNLQNKVITYTPTSVLTKSEKLNITVTGIITYTNEKNETVTKEGTVTFIVYIIPASTVYYEDSFATFTDGSYNSQDVKWDTVTDVTTQENVTQALEALGSKQNVYGYDPAYNSSTQYSLGSAHKVTVSSTMAGDKNVVWPSATFTFKGTGFDIISLTDNTSGAIYVDVYKGSEATGTPVKRLVVNNYYGYKYENNEWIVSNEAGANPLYQIPVMKVDLTTSDTYTAVITVAYASRQDKTGDSEYTFVLDAIRVYNPMGKDYDYGNDGEKSPSYVEIKKVLLDTSALSKENATGAVFIDGKGSNVTATEYANYGPNHEAYLANSQAIAFQLVASAEPTSVQLGAKLANGTAGSLTISGASCVKVSEGVLSLNTSTDMYYELTGLEWSVQSDGTYKSNVITLTNNGKEGSIISLTNLKFIGATYTNKSADVENATSGVALLSLAASPAMVDEAVLAVSNVLYDDPEPTPDPEPEVKTFEPDTFKVSLSKNSISTGQKATLTVKASAEVTAITVNGETYDSYTTRYERSGWNWWSAKTEYHVFTVSLTPAETTEYNVVAVNADGAVSETETVTLTVKAAQSNWWDNVWNNFFGKWF